jgi:BirA family biotin operon repressor/biotin-[acetyl-CoA-carboxylase] ligase
MSSPHQALLALLADGSPRSAVELASQLQLDRDALSGLVQELRERGVAVANVPGGGYCLPEAVELLDAGRIAEYARRRGTPLPQPVEVLFEIGSTNTYLADATPPPPGQSRIVLAELQHAGRGRRGRSWLAPFGSGLTFSVAWTFPGTPPGLAALGLALGVAVAEALRGLGLAEARLKWPNDVVWRGRKLGGLLLQLRTETGGAATVVAGLGLNLSLPEETRAALAGGGALPVADLREAMAAGPPGRNELAAALASAMLDALAGFERSGFAPFAGRWAALDALAGECVLVSDGTSDVEGEACGVDAAGALQLRIDGELRRFLSGDVSLRPSRP